MPTVVVLTTLAFDTQLSEGVRTKIMAMLNNKVAIAYGLEGKDVEVVWPPANKNTLNSLPLTIYVEMSVGVLGLFWGWWGRRMLRHSILDWIRSTPLLPYGIEAGVWIRPLLGAKFETANR